MNEEEAVRRQIEVLTHAIKRGRQAREETKPFVGMLRFSDGSKGVGQSTVMDRWDEVIQAQTDALREAELRLAEILARNI